jgi:hypothetical protein
MPSLTKAPLPTEAATDNLRAAVKQVRTVLIAAGPEDAPTWTGLAWYALARLERVLADEVKNAGAPDGLLAEIDQTRPTFLRQQQKLVESYRHLLEQCIALKWEMFTASQSRAVENPFLGRTPPLRSSGAGTVTDFAALRKHVAQFVTLVEQCREEEAKLILESSTTDIGAGD